MNFYELPEDAKRDIYDIIHGRKNLIKDLYLNIDQREDE